MHHANTSSPPRPRLRGRWLKTAGAGLCVLALGAAAGCSSSGTSSASTASQASTASGHSVFPGGTSLQGKTILMVIYTQPLAAWTPAVNGAKAVEASTGLKVDVEYANNNDQTEISEIEAGISRNVAGMALQIDDTAVAHAVCSAAQKGIPVIAWNNDALTGSSASCVQAYVGQNPVTAGLAIGQYMVQHGYVKSGAHVFCPVEVPTAVYAAGRAQGVNQALAAVGAKCDVVGVGTTDSGAVSTMTEYLLGHRNTTAIIALGGIPFANAPAVLTKMSMNIPVGGFDVYDPRIPKAIAAGKIVAAVDQQFYSQGFYAAQQLALELQYGLYPSDMDTGGSGVVTKANVGDLVALSGTYR
jgi:simple sugar transport system substrate-binding protein